MTIADGCWFAIGLCGGGWHAWMLWRAVQPPFLGTAWVLPRLFATGLMFFAAAFFGGIFPAFLGWAIAYFLTVGRLRTGAVR